MYVANYEYNTVFVISANTVVGSPITVGHGPAAFAYDPDDKDMYVVNSGGGTVSVIDAFHNSTGAEDQSQEH